MFGLENITDASFGLSISPVVSSIISSPKKAIVSSYPFLPFFIRSFATSSAMIINALKFSFIRLSTVLLPQPTPPVIPITFITLYHSFNIIKHILLLKIMCLMCFKPVISLFHINFKRNRQLNCIFHSVLNYLLYIFYFIRISLNKKFIMNLQ